MVGEQVYYTGTGKTFENGDQLEQGEQGEVVVLPQGLEQGEQGKGVVVYFPGNKRPTSCYLSEVRRRRRCAATHSSPPAQLPLLPAHHTWT